MLAAFLAALQGPWGELLGQLLREDRVLGVELMWEAIWHQVSNWLLETEGTEGDQLESSLEEIWRRLERHQGWYEVIEPLAREFNCRPQWLWRFAGWIILRGTEQEYDALQEAFIRYCRQYETPLRWDYVIEVTLRDEPSKEEHIRTVTYRRVSYDDVSDIVIRREENVENANRR